MTTSPPGLGPTGLAVSSAAAKEGVVADGGPLSGVPRWVLGVAIGVPVAAAFAYILFGGSSEPGPKKKKKLTTPVKVVEDVTKKELAEKEKAAKEAAAEEAAKKSEESVEVEDVPEGPTDPLEKAVAAKNRGNKYFRGGRYELAIKCYTEAIDLCPQDKSIDLATFHQNRAAAFDQLEDLEAVVGDCDTAINLNNKYVKALDRRAKTLRKQAMKVEDFGFQVEKLKQCLEDITSVCILEGFQKQEHLVMVDSVLKELGRAEAADASKSRQPVLTSTHFINQYLSSFSQDPILKSLEKEIEADIDEKEIKDTSRGYLAARECLKKEKYEEVISHCDYEISTSGLNSSDAKLLRATFYILTKQQTLAMQDLTSLIEDQEAAVKLRVNALIKRASLFIQQCKDPSKDPQLSFADFEMAVQLDPDNADIYHHRGQVHLLIDELNKAIVDFNKAVALQPNFPVAYVQKLYTDYRAASTIGDHSKVNEVLGQFKEATEKFPKCVETYALFAQVMNDQQEFDKADELYKQGIIVDPTNANLLVHRGLGALQSKGDVTAAVNLIQSALELDEKCEFAYETLGTIEVQRGNLKRAIELFNKAIPLANTELEMAHLYGLRDAAMAQITVSTKLGITLPPMGMMG